MALSDYLASKYLSADTKKSSSKKRKRQKEETSGFQIADDTLDSWTRAEPDANDDDDNDNNPQIVSADPTQINRRTATWTTIGAAAPTNAEQEAADAILAKAESERQARAVREVEDDAPAVVGDVADAASGPTMASGALAGLQTAAQVAAALERRQRDEKRAMEEQGLDPNGKATETIYRDASGRVINVAMKRAELRRKAEEDEKARKQEAISRLGDVQRREKEAARQRLDDAKYLAVARYADDRELNDELKDKARWNDPAAQFLSTKTGASAKAGKKASRKKVYEGAHEPNRYNIKPGFRWDGVDRSNGFERKWFAARNKKANTKELEYAWEMDV